MTPEPSDTLELPARPAVPDGDAAEAFAARIAAALDAGATATLLSIGHRAGLLDSLAAMPPATSAELAEAAGKVERYVREWLNGMVTARIVDYDAATRRYSLPAAHAACLTTGAALGNLAVYAQHVALLGKMEDTTLRLIAAGGGTSYGEYPCFHDIMSEDSAQTVVAGLFDHIVPLADGLDGRLAEGIDVLDAGCGRGLALMAMAERYPASRFVGYDLCGDVTAAATAEAARRGLRNVRFERRDLTGYAEPGRWDLVTSFDAIHDQKDPAGLVRGIGTSLRPCGIYLVQDIGGSANVENNLYFPFATFLYAISLAHCTPVSIGQGGAGLGTMWGWETAEAMLGAAGFASVERHVLPHDPMNVWFVARR